MSIKTYIRAVTLLVVGAALAFSCTFQKEELGFDLTPAILCQKGELGSAMLNEDVVVNVVNISESTTVTVKFGREKTLTRKGPGTISYAFTSSGLKTISVTLDSDEVEKTIWRVEVKALESLQSLAKKLKNDPQLCLVMAHRGNSSDWSIPENSLSAINKCIEDGIDCIEIDLYTTKDGHLVVSHDAYINRETTGTGYIRNKTLSQIKSVYLKDRNGNPTTEKMLTFDELLDACNGLIYINVDIGDREAEIKQVVDAVTRKGMTQQVLIFCNSVEKIQQAFAANPNAIAYTTNASANLSAIKQHGLPEYTYFTQASWFPTTAAASANGKPSATAAADVSYVANGAAKGMVVTINAIYTNETKVFYKKDFTVAQVEEIFRLYPSCQCIQVDTGKEAKDALVKFGKKVTERL